MFDINELLEVLVFSGIGVLVFAVAFFVMVKIAPFSVQKEIEEDQNTALAIIIGSCFIALAIIISAAIT